MTEPVDERPGRGRGPSVGLFVTCLVDLFRPSVGFAAATLLERAGCRVAVPAAQTCCGQPGYNSGDRKTATAVARATVAAFEDFDYVVAPSGSCAGMLRKHYPALLADEPAWADRAHAFSKKCHEITGFLVDVLGTPAIDSRYDGICAYHDSCSSLREMRVREQPRRLMAGVAGASLRDLPSAEACCGFGGTFCVKYPEISGFMAGEKVREIVESGADTLIAGDLGCLLNLAGKLQREGRPIRAYHVAELLAGVEVAPIGAPERERPQANGAETVAGR